MGSPAAESASHNNMSAGFDAHMRRRGDIDRHLTHLSVEADGLRFAVEALANGGVADTEKGRARQSAIEFGADHRLAAQLADEVAMLDSQIETAQALSSARRNDIADLRSILAERRAAARKHFGVSEVRSVLSELGRVEERIRRMEDERLELSQAAFARRSAAEYRRREVEDEGQALREQRDDLSRRIQELEAEVRIARDAVEALRAARAMQPSGGATRATPQRNASGLTLAVPGDAAEANAAPSPSGSAASGGAVPAGSRDRPPAVDALRRSWRRRRGRRHPLLVARAR